MRLQCRKFDLENDQAANHHKFHKVREGTKAERGAESFMSPKPDLDCTTINHDARPVKAPHRHNGAWHLQHRSHETSKFNLFKYQGIFKFGNSINAVKALY